MTNLTTRNIVFGMLMAFVLALGVQGTADALTFGATRTNDLQNIVSGGSFSVGFAVNVVTEVRKPAYTDYQLDTTDSTRYFLDSTSGDNDNDQYDNGESTVSTANAFHYNNEAVSISVSGAGARITSIGNNPITPATSITLKEGGSGAEELAASITVNCSTTTHGEVTITARDATPNEDYPSGVRKAPNFVLTTYVVRFNQDVGVARTIRLVGVANGVAIGYDDQRDQPIYNGDSSHYPVTYTVAGGGQVYIQEGNRQGTAGATLTTSSAAKVLLDMNSVTNTVTAKLGGSFESSQGIYIFGNPQLNITNGDRQVGNPNDALATALQVTLLDNAATPTGIVGVPIKFDVTDKTPSGGILSPATDTIIVDASNEVISSPIPGDTMYVRTGTGGVASIAFRLGTIPGKQTVTAGALGIARLTKTIEATARGTAATRQLFTDDIDRHGSTNIYTLVARVENGGQPDSGQVVTFTTTKGLLTGKNLQDDGTVGTTTVTAKTVYEATNEAGKARIVYNIGDASGNAEVVASISVITGTRITQLQEVTFNVRGRSSGQQQNQQNQQNQGQPTGSLEIFVPPGEGATRSVTVTATSVAGTATVIPVVLTGTALGGGTRSVTSGTAIEITLPTEPDDYTLTATASVAGYTPDTETITVAGPTSLGTISITSIGTPTNGIQTFSITVVDTNNNRISGALTVRVSGTGFTTRDVPTANGAGAIGLPLPTAARLYTLTASAEGYESGTTQIRVAGTAQTTTTDTPTTTPTTTPETTVREPDRVSIVGPSQRTGTTNTELDASLIVQVVDEDGDAVEDTRVIFRVRTGQGRLTQRGNGRAVVVQTDSRGHARATYTPMSASSTIEVEARGVTRRVTFTITASGGAPTETPTPTSTRAPGDAIHPVVHIGAAGRPPMLWVDSGAIYALVGANVQRFIPSVDNALNIAIGGTKVYWTEKTGESSGTINSANLDGTGVKELTEIMAVPMGIVVDTANRKLYWTNSRGRIQRANLDGSIIQNVLENLTSPLDIALSGGNVYWTHSNGGVGFVNLTGQKQIRNISNGADASGSLAIGGRKIYWTEKSGESGGTINSANLDGSGAKQLASILATPSGIAVDPARSKLFWTNSRGRIQSATLEGSSIQNVVDGLGSPGDMVLSNSIKAPAGTTPTPTTPTPQTTRTTPTYDVDGSGTVDNVDLFLVTLAVGTRNTQYDVNGDGTVDDKDIILVRENRDDAAAAAPMIVGVQLTPEQVSRLQAQIDLLVATSDRSPAALKTLIYLQQLLATARPEQTQLLANYPNPFNPETWIPYELATDTDVRITIYNAQGVGIRTLQLGQQSAGYYTDRERAAYWDGRNALGEQVASGIYFYQLETDTLSSLRKMVILK